MMHALCQISQLSLKIAQRDLIKQLDLTILPGQCWSVIGRNGAGKSSLLRTIAGMRAPESGDISIDGQTLKQWSLQDLAKKRAFLAQGRIDAFAYSAIETVLSARHPYQDSHYWESDADIALAHAALAELDVLELTQRDVRSLSGGERQRVAIAALLAQDADLMLLDEPANALDLAHQVSVMQLFSKLCQSTQRFDRLSKSGLSTVAPEKITSQIYLKKAVVMVRHDLNLAYRVASHALLMMPDGTWLAGEKQSVMRADHLSQCLGHPIERFEHGRQILFMPVEPD